MTEWVVALVTLLLVCGIIPFIFLFLNYKQHMKNDIGTTKKSRWKLFFFPPG
jgi:hypothetical protein